MATHAVISQADAAGASAGGSLSRTLRSHEVPTVAVADAHAMWSPHRDSREVKLWKSLLGFRGEPWHWVEQPEQARWFVVDVARGVEPAWTEALRHQPHVKGIALARQWIDLPAPCWTFFKVPLRSDQVLIWLDQEMGRRPSSGAGMVRLGLRPAATGWQHAELRLTRWPDVTRYGDGALDLTVACGLLLRQWTRYEEVARLVQDRQLLDALLGDAQRRGHLLVAYGSGHGQDAAALTAAEARAHVAQVAQVSRESQAPVQQGRAAGRSAVAESSVDDGRWSLLKRLWKRFS